MGVVEQIGQRARELPTATALVSDASTITFAELAARSERIAEGLRARGVTKGDIVGVLGERSAELVTMLLGIWKLGAVFLPLDPAYPFARLAFMIADAGVQRCVTLADPARTGA